MSTHTANVFQMIGRVLRYFNNNNNKKHIKINAMLRHASYVNTHA